jgi:hypothetical protein
MERQLVDEAEKLEASVHRHRLRIINDILTLHCPWCQAAFSDFVNCFAVQHLGHGQNGKEEGCGRYFCAWCLEACEGFGPCHGHVRACAAAPPKYQGTFVGDDVEFNRIHSLRRREEVLEYLRTKVTGGAAEQDRLREALAADLRDLGIQL